MIRTRRVGEGLPARAQPPLPSSGPREYGRVKKDEPFVIRGEPTRGGIREDKNRRLKRVWLLVFGDVPKEETDGARTNRKSTRMSELKDRQ